MADKNFFMRDQTENAVSFRREVKARIINANVCMSAYKVDNKFKTLIAFNYDPVGQKFDRDTLVLKNLSNGQLNMIRDNDYICLKFKRKVLDSLFAYNKDTGE